MFYKSAIIKHNKTRINQLLLLFSSKARRKRVFYWPGIGNFQSFEIGVIIWHLTKVSEFPMPLSNGKAHCQRNDKALLTQSLPSN